MPFADTTPDDLFQALADVNYQHHGLDNFSYSASHDLKQPIANMEGLLDALHEELPADLAAAQPIGTSFFVYVPVADTPAA